VTTRPRLSIRGDVNVTGEGLSATLSGDGEVLLLTVHEMTAPKGVRRWISSAAGNLADVDNQLQVRDSKGRLLATAGSGIRSLVGRILVGSFAVRPRVLNIVRQRRNRTPPVRVRGGEQGEEK
jgi:hypothetical protein